MTDITPSAEQLEAFKAIKNWHKFQPEKPFFYLAGYAGTGKTTIAKLIAEDLGGRSMFGAFTGKASMVLRNKGCKDASTIHSMVYSPIEHADGTVTYILNEASKVQDADIVIIDECSMVDEPLAKDLLSFGTPILVLGDPAQLPPVGGEGYFTRNEPDFILTEIHRQARENPIIAMSMLVRNHRELPYGNYGSSRVIREDEFDLNDVLAAEQILCGKNATRNWTNNRIRELKGQTGKFPVLKEKLICLQNNRKKGLLNGSMWEVDSIKKTYATSIVMDVKSLDEGMSTKPANVFVYETDFTGGQDTRDWKDKKKFDSFTFGYCITVHKSQGSQWDNVLLFDESQVFREERYRHLYTAITRAADRITIVS